MGSPPQLSPVLPPLVSPGQPNPCARRADRFPPFTLFLQNKLLEIEYKCEQRRLTGSATRRQLAAERRDKMKKWPGRFCNKTALDLIRYYYRHWETDCIKRHQQAAVEKATSVGGKCSLNNGAKGGQGPGPGGSDGDDNKHRPRCGKHTRGQDSDVAAGVSFSLSLSSASACGKGGGRGGSGDEHKGQGSWKVTNLRIDTGEWVQWA